jgi:uncharacterized protein
MKVHLRQIPVEGLHLEGEEDSSILELQPGMAASPIRYALDVGVSGAGLFATGSLEVDLNLQCVGCLEIFPFCVHVNSFAMQTELGSSETVDLTPYVREDILLALPAHPHCEKTAGLTCKGIQINTTEPNELPQTPEIWVELDKLKVRKS